MLYSGYTNPYYQTVVAAQPAQTTVVYDYSQPINVTARRPTPRSHESTEQIFSAARDSFKAGDYQRALDLADQVLKQTPNAPVVHEFRALVLFALKRYDEAAAVDYAVLSAGPGWNWSTLVGLYPDVDTYTNQLRALEAYARSNPGSSSPQFLLGYHYLVEGHNDAAAAQFEKVTQLQPNESLSASFVKLLRKASEAQSQTQTQTQVAAAPTNDQPTPAAPGPAQDQQETPPHRQRTWSEPGRRSPVAPICRSPLRSRPTANSPGRSTARARRRRCQARLVSRMRRWRCFRLKGRHWLGR